MLKNAFVKDQMQRNKRLFRIDSQTLEKKHAGLVRAY